MALILGDVHGNYPKAKAFLEYKPEEEKLITGDLFDSYLATNELISETAKMLYDSNAIVLGGNHCLQYFNAATTQLKCTGFRPEAYNFTHLVEMYKDQIKASHVVDGYLITHAGVTKALTHYRGSNDIEVLNEWFNEEFDKWKNSPLPVETLSPIFHIGSARGGRDKISGPFWADYRYEKFDSSFNQIFGHSYSSEAKLLNVGKYPHKLHVCIDCPQYHCFNTKTGQLEDFFPEEFIKHRYMMERQY